MAIPNHRLGAVIGQGGMATVYRAEHVLLKQERAIKILSPELSRTPGFQESFYREGRIVASLRHPHIITVHDIGHSDEGYFMAMEYLKGGSLKDRLKRGPIRLPEATLFLRQIAEALDHAHNQGLVHRDIKPANILFHDDGNAVLTDFGISKLQDVEGDLTRHGYLMVGTPRYMSPEQTASQPLDRRSDVYSLALLFFEMLTAKAAIHGKDALEVIREHALAPPPTLPQEYRSLQPVIDKALAKQPQDRYGSTLEFTHAIEQNLASSGNMHSPIDAHDERHLHPTPHQPQEASTTLPKLAGSDATTILEAPSKTQTPVSVGKGPTPLFYLGGALVAAGLIAWQWPEIRLTIANGTAPSSVLIPTQEAQPHSNTDEVSDPIPVNPSTIEPPTPEQTIARVDPPPSSSNAISGTVETTLAPHTTPSDRQPTDELAPVLTEAVVPPSTTLPTPPEEAVDPQPSDFPPPDVSEIATSPQPRDEPSANVDEDTIKPKETTTTISATKPSTKMRVRVNPYAIVYQQPGGGERLGRAYKNTEIEVYDTITASDGTQWKQVLLGDTPGFLKADQLTTN